MRSIINRFFKGAGAVPAENSKWSTGHDARVAVCALFIEMARIDETFSDDELAAIIAILTQRYGLSAADADDLMAAARQQLDESIDYWQFARLINRHYSTEEKIEVIELLWEIVYVDGRMDRHENYLMHKLADLLRLTHGQLIDAKLKALGKA